MIQVRVRRNGQDRSIRSFAVEGHADFDVPGKDIVCSAVSAVTIGTVNAMDQLLGTAPIVEMEKGWLYVELPTLDGEVQPRAQLLLESMIVSLKTIEESYGAYIVLQEQLV